MRFFRKSGGFTFLELLVAMAVFAILGSAIAGVVKTGLGSYHSISSDMYHETEARTALSLITVQLRQHDSTGAVSLDSDRKILRLKDNPSLSSKGTVIWFSNHKLYTAEVGDVNAPIEEISAPSAIAAIEDVAVEAGKTPDQTAFTYTVRVNYGENGEKTLSQTITQRSAPQVP